MQALMFTSPKQYGIALNQVADVVIGPLKLVNKTFKLSACKKDDDADEPREEFTRHEKQIIKGICSKYRSTRGNQVADVKRTFIEICVIENFHMYGLSCIY